MDMTLTAVFEEVPESEGGGYVAYARELLGAISEGDTLEEARENLRDAIAVPFEASYSWTHILARIRGERNSSPIAEC